MKSKAEFQTLREKSLSHGEKKELAYWISQGIDLEQLNHISGKDIQKWK